MVDLKRLAASPAPVPMRSKPMQVIVITLIAKPASLANAAGRIAIQRLSRFRGVDAKEA